MEFSSVFFFARCVAVSCCEMFVHVFIANDGISSHDFDSHVWFNILSFNEISTVGCRWRLRWMRRHSHVLIAATNVSDQSVLLVAHWGERLSCFGRRSSSAIRCVDAFWLLVSRSTASQCSRPFRFHFWRLSLCLSVLLANFSDDHTVLRRR